MIGDAVDRATDRVGDRVTNILLGYALKMVFAVAALILFVGVVVCGCIAVFWVLEPEFGPMVSIAIVAGGLGLGAIVCGLATMVTGREPTLAGTVEPVEVAKEESREAIEMVGPYKFVAAALGIGAAAGGLLGGGRRDRDPSSNASILSSIIGLAPTAISALTLLNSTNAARSSEQAARSSQSAARAAADQTASTRSPA